MVFEKRCFLQITVVKMEISSFCSKEAYSGKLKEACISQKNPFG
jgi:hypothetical protein